MSGPPRSIALLREAEVGRVRRWAIEIDARNGRARLVEPAPLDAAVTIYFGLADRLRVAAGLTGPLIAMAAGRCSIEGDVLVAARLESMFGAV